MSGKIKDIGISYDRFSDPKQGHGESEGRQDRAFAGFCERHQLQPSTEHFIDRGKSGYHDTHYRKGDMGRLVELAKSGAFRVQKGSPSYVLVVEAWDRLGRLRPDKAVKRISDLLRAGLKIGICRLDDIFTLADFGTHKWVTLCVFVQLAYEESKQKSERLADVWDQRRKRAREKGELLPSTVPAWLQVVNGKYKIIPERKKVIERIFQLSRDGYGLTLIVKTLDNEGVPAFGDKPAVYQRKRGQFSGLWNRSYVRLILNDRRVLGEYQPMVTVLETVKDKDGNPIKDADGNEVDRLTETKGGDPMKGYFPRIISDEVFAAAALAQSKRKKYDGKLTRQRKCINVFAGLLQNAADGGEGFILHNKGSRTALPLMLINAKGHHGRAPLVSFPYVIFEKAVLGMLREVSSKELAPRHQGDGPNPVEVLGGKLAHAAEQVEQFKAELRKKHSPDLVQLLHEWRERHDEIKAEYERVLAERTNPLTNDWDKFPSLADALDNATDPTGARVRLQTVLSRAIKTIHLLVYRKGADAVCWVQVDFAANNVHREYILRYHAAGFHRVGFWQVSSWRADEYPATVCQPIDLGQPEIAGMPGAKMLPFMLANLEGMIDYADVCFKHDFKHPIPK
jgi:DNA invertase Pin-like site-specific DNA recombinase